MTSLPPPEPAVPAAKALPKSLFRRPGTKHFQLVHRSQRDPLIHDPDASERVLKPVDASQPIKLPPSSSASSATNLAPDEETLGDAASYGIYFNDSEYNYMQHLRQVGDGETSSSFLVEAPSSKKSAKKQVDFAVLDSLPEDALPSHPMDEISYEELTASKAPVGGLRPDLDPAVREVLEALEDEAYVVDVEGEGTDGEEDFWDEVVQGGEVQEGEEIWSDEEEEEQEERELGLEERVARFKLGHSKGEGDSDDEEEEDEFSEGGDTIADLRASNARRPPRKQASNAGGSQFSMTSSAMFRNEGLRTLDDRFDQIEKMYAEDDSDSSWGSHSDDDTRPIRTLAPPRADLDEIMDEFLSRYEVLGGKIRPVLEPTPGEEGGAGKLDRIRRELASLEIGDEVEGEDSEVKARRAEKERILEAVERQQREEDSKTGKVKIAWEKPKERWDCETVLSTYSNVSNHPRILRVVREGGPRPARIRIDEKTGFPIVEGEESMNGHKRKDAVPMEEDEDSDDESSFRPGTIIRPKGETPEERKARKMAIKEERLARRVEKKGTKESFANETKRQKRIAGKAVAGGAAADVRVGEGVRRLA